MTNGEAVVTNGEAVVTNGETVVTNGKAVVTNGKAVVTNGKAVVANGKAVVTNGKAVVLTRLIDEEHAIETITNGFNVQMESLLASLRFRPGLKTRSDDVEFSR